jgi:pyruvate dehydrogenase E2 component (dihydrolipoamide acetyltransferase)
MTEIIMPKMGDAMTEGRVLKWYKKQGDKVTTGEAVVEIETDKVNLDLEAEDDGVLEAIEVEPGEMVPVGTPLAIIGSGDGTAASKKVARSKAGAAKTPAKETRDKEESAAARPRSRKRKDSVHERKTAEQEVPAASNAHPRSSPLARKIAARLDVNIDEIVGSGPRGRIIAADVQRAAREMKQAVPSATAEPTPVSARPEMPTAVPLEEKVIPLTAMRRTIARRLSESTGPIPHFYLTADCDVTDLLALREQLITISGAKVSVNDFVIRAAALAIHHHPYVNASFGEESIAYHGEVHVGVAVATDDGLITPVIRDADGKSVIDISAEVRDLAAKARSRKLKPDEHQGATFTISNLGMYGIEEFTAIINPPNAAILAVSTAAAKPVVVDREIVVRDRMKVTMSCDHRVIDGAAGAEFLQTFRRYLEQPLRLVL